MKKTARKCVSCGAPERVNSEFGFRLTNITPYSQLCTDCINKAMKAEREMSVRNEWGVECPECHADTGLIITCTAEVKLLVDGTEEISSGHEWDGRSLCRCERCGWAGTVGDAQDALYDPNPKEKQ